MKTNDKIKITNEISNIRLFAIERKPCLMLIKKTAKKRMGS
jgi:hypothetical protein